MMMMLLKCQKIHVRLITDFYITHVTTNIKMALPTITANEYRAYIDECLNNPSIGQEWRDLMNLRKKHAVGLRYIIPYESLNIYILLYETRYIVKIVSPQIRTVLGMTNDTTLKVRGVTHYLLERHSWFEELPIGDNSSVFDMISYGVQNISANPYVGYFCVRFEVLLFRPFQISHVIPAGFNPPYADNNSVIVCYGKGTEPSCFNTQFSVYLSTLIRLLASDVSDEDVVDILCTQLTNEIVALDNADGQMKIDQHLVRRVQMIFADKPMATSTAVNKYLQKIRSLPSGLELTGYTVSMIRQIIPECEITVLSHDEEDMFRNTVTHPLHHD